MNSFINQLFPKFTSPGAAFVYDADLSTWAYNVLSQSVFFDGMSFSVPLTITQPMTPLGLMSAHLTNMGSSYDGLAKHYLTAEGHLSMPAIEKSLRQMSGLSSEYIWRANLLNLEDNHVSLLFNMFRYVLLSKMREVKGDLNGAFGNFVDNELIINMDQWWEEGYVADAPFTAWPTRPESELVAGKREHRGVVVTYIDVAFSDDDVATLDLHGNSPRESVFILAMLNAWHRSSRCRLDFELPELVHRVAYRGTDVSVAYKGWAIADPAVPFPMLTSSEAWKALQKYVSRNGIFDQFSVALWLVAVTMYQYVPDTAESTAWLSLKWRLTLPKFYSIRGRFIFLKTGKAAFLNQRSLDEWAWIASKLEKVNLMALCFAQGFSAGIALRGTRKCIEMEPKDIYMTDSDFWSADYFASAAVAEFTRISVPLGGMSGVDISCDLRLDEIKEDREIVSLTSVDTPVPATHSYGRRQVIARLPQTRRVKADDLAADYPNRAELLKSVLTKKAMASAARAIDPAEPLEADYEAALDNELFISDQVEAPQNVWTVKVPMLTQPGFPTLLVPVQPAPYNTPYTFQGVLDKDTGQLHWKGNYLDAREAWRVIAFMRNVGYEAEYRIHGETIGAPAYIKGQHTQQTWPVLFEGGDARIPVTGQNMEVGARFVLPSVYDASLKTDTIRYSVRVYRMGVSQGRWDFKGSISECGGGGPAMTKVSSVGFSMDEGPKVLHGFVRRGDTDFLFAPAVVPGAN